MPLGQGEDAVAAGILAEIGYHQSTGEGVEEERAIRPLESLELLAAQAILLPGFYLRG